MKNFQRGFGLIGLLIILGLVVIGGGVYFYIQGNQSTSTLQNNRVTTSPQTSSYAPLFELNGGPGAPDCYYAKGGQVYVSVDGGKSFSLVTGADVTSFKDVSIFGFCFGEDNIHVYRDTQSLQGYSPSSFKVLWYIKTMPGPVLFIQRDASSIGAFSFSEDRDGAFVSSSVVPNGDPTSFKELVGAYDFGPWAKDKNNVYCLGQVLVGADPATAQTSSQGTNLTVTVSGVSKTVDSSCNVSSSLIQTHPQSQSPTPSNPVSSQQKTFTSAQYGFTFDYPSDIKITATSASQLSFAVTSNLLTGSNGLDSGAIHITASEDPADLFTCTTPSKDTPPQTTVSGPELTVINGLSFTTYTVVTSNVTKNTETTGYIYAALPKNICYVIATALIKKNTTTLTPAQISLATADDAEVRAKLDSVLQSFRVTIPSTPTPFLTSAEVGADPKTFVALGFNYWKDAQHVYYNKTIIINADLSTFVAVSSPWFAKDSHSVYFEAKPIADSDPNSFRVTDPVLGKAKDNNHSYSLDLGGFLYIDGVQQTQGLGM